MTTPSSSRVARQFHQKVGGKDMHEVSLRVVDSSGQAWWIDGGEVWVKE